MAALFAGRDSFVENARKNTGRPVFAFNLFQVGMLPAVYRPPLAVANKAVAS